MTSANELTVSPVWQKNWDAMHARTPQGRRRYKYIINRGSSRSSKTYSLIDCLDLYAREHRNKRLTVWRDTKKDCKDTVLKDAIKHLRMTGRYGVGQTFNKTDSVFTYDTDSTFEIHGTDDEEKVHGLTQDAAWLNEPYKISEATFNQIDQRTSDFIFIDYNPKAGHWVENLMKDPRALVIDSTFRDNPFCPEEQRLKLLSYQPVKWSKIVMDKRDALMAAGEPNEQKVWEAAEAYGQAYDIDANPAGYSRKLWRELERCRFNEAKNSASEFNWLVYGLGQKAERKGLVYRNWKECDALPAEYDWQVVGVDFGFSNDPTAVILVRCNAGRLYFDELVYQTELTNRELLMLIHRQAASMQLPSNILYFCDHETDRIIELQRGFKGEGLPGIRAAEARKGAGSIIPGIAKLHEYQCFYTKRSANLKIELDNYEYKEDKMRKQTENGEKAYQEMPIDDYNHALDACRYAVFTQTMRSRT